METTQDSPTNTRNIWRRRPQFSLRVLLFAMTALSVGLAFFAYLMEIRRHQVAQQIARSILQQELMQRHWEVSETNAGMGQLVGQLSKDFSGSKQSSWDFDVIDATTGTSLLKVSKPAQSLDDFEKQALQQIQAGATEVARATWDGEVRYVQAIKTAKSCDKCHSKTDQKAGRMAVVSVRRPPNSR